MAVVLLLLYRSLGHQESRINAGPQSLGVCPVRFELANFWFQRNTFANRVTTTDNLKHNFLYLVDFIKYCRENEKLIRP